MVRNADIGTSVETRAVFGFSKTGQSEEWSGVSLEIKISVVPFEGVKISYHSAVTTRYSNVIHLAQHYGFEKKVLLEKVQCKVDHTMIHAERNPTIMTPYEQALWQKTPF